MKKTFKLALTVKNCTQEFQEGMGVGVLVTQELTFDLEPEQYERPMFIMGLSDQMEEFLMQNVEVVVEES